MPNASESVIIRHDICFRKSCCTKPWGISNRVMLGATYKKKLGTKYVWIFSTITFVINKKPHWEQTKRDFLNKLIFATFGVEYLKVCTNFQPIPLNSEVDPLFLNNICRL